MQKKEPILDSASNIRSKRKKRHTKRIELGRNMSFFALLLTSLGLVGLSVYLLMGDFNEWWLFLLFGVFTFPNFGQFYNPVPKKAS